ncbi:hypothetical protein [Arachnia propionica]|uniref:Tetratricopeptide repeat protein n=1 Tax=Arachnia propionica TaxID=1750 RepID=A0A3P1WVU3_9ACTN|nr:hypothetical protein [Arachnia propionica]RRD50345.1 hypothetical protein EII35_05190 [Arachnia propionica]
MEWEELEELAKRHGVEPEVLAELNDRAHQMFEAGQLADAADLFAGLTGLVPDHSPYHYMLGLARKYLRQWPESLAANLKAIELAEEFDEAAHWNAGIAATALSDWATARRIWEACGIELTPGEGEIREDFGFVVLLLNPWGDMERVFARRIDPVRAEIVSVPYPQYGHLYGDIVLHDGASLGVARVGQRELMVFNELQRLTPSTSQTFIAEVTCDDPGQFQELLDALSELGEAEDWTQRKWICSSCARGDQEGVQEPHEHDESELEWAPDREVAVAAENYDAVTQVLAAWEEPEGRKVRTLTPVEPEVISDPEDGTFWWEARP